MTNVTTAQTVCERMGSDGQRFEAADGTPFEAVCELYGARTEYADLTYDVYGRLDTVTPRSRSEVTSDTAIRYVFPDGSALVNCGDAWDLEGGTPFSWESV
jgi:hypothetical protein